MFWTALPATAAWTHSGAQTGFEVAWFDSGDGGAVLTGCTARLVYDAAGLVLEYPGIAARSA
jgi:uncharacterized protein